MVYQSFSGVKGDSDSFAKLKALCLPDLKGKKVLDIGCNEGFFCIEAKKNGASKVVGIDSNLNCIESARRRAKESNLDIEFLHQSWDNLPEEKFDVVLFLSTLHYVKDKKKFLDSVANVLSQDGFLILECGVVNDRSGELIEIKRPVRDVVYHPTYRYLIDYLLSSFSVRDLGPSVNQVGDNIPRFVFHCYRYSPIVVLIPGAPKEGKTSLVREFKRQDISAIETDPLMDSISKSSEDNMLFSLIKDEYNSQKKDICLRKIIKAGMGKEFALEIIKRIKPARFFVIEGYALSFSGIYEPLIASLKEKGYIIWEVKRKK